MGELRPEHVKYLSDRGITDSDVIEARGYESVANGLKIPIYDIATNKKVNHEVRLDVVVKVGKKFDRPSGIGNTLNINPLMHARVKDAKSLLLVVEGTTRADALAQQGIAAVSLTGIWGWRSNKREGTLRDWQDLGLENRTIIVVPDGDVLTNPDVNRATHDLLEFLNGSRKAKARVAVVPDGAGLDDWMSEGNGIFDLYQHVIDHDKLPRLKVARPTPESVAKDFDLQIDDRTLAEMWVSQNPDHAIRVVGTDRWYFYDGRVWVRDGSNASNDAKAALGKFLAGISDRFKDEIERTTDGLKQKTLREIVSELRSRRKLTDVYSMFATLGLGESSVHEETFDRDPYLFNVANGTVDLRTSLIKKHDPQDHLRGRSDTDYSPDADMSVWVNFLMQVFKNDVEMIEWLQLVFGSALIARTVLQILPVLVGKGRNGKGTLVRAIQNALGSDMTTTLDKSLLITNKYESHPTKLMALKGKRLAFASETEDGDKFAAASVKALTGGDEITARGMREDQQTFVPSHNMVLMTNTLPEVDVSDEAMWARLKLITFPVSFADNPDLQIDQKLAAVAPGVLRWLVEGARKFIDSGQRLPSDPMSVLNATGNWRMQGNSLIEFLNSKVTRQEGASVPAGKFQDDYRRWAEQSGLAVLHTTAFARTMEASGWEKKKTEKGLVWVGMRYLTHNEEVTEGSQPTNPAVVLHKTPTTTAASIPRSEPQDAVAAGDAVVIPTFPNNETTFSTPSSIAAELEKPAAPATPASPDGTVGGIPLTLLTPALDLRPMSSYSQEEQSIIHQNFSTYYPARKHLKETL